MFLYDCARCSPLLTLVYVLHFQYFCWLSLFCYRVLYYKFRVRTNKLDHVSLSCYNLALYLHWPIDDVITERLLYCMVQCIVCTLQYLTYSCCSWSLKGLLVCRFKCSIVIFYLKRTVFKSDNIVTLSLALTFWSETSYQLK